MLPPNYLKQVEKQAINIYGNLELEIIQEIAERIKNRAKAKNITFVLFLKMQEQQQ